jgi:hypothetical protein
MDVCPEAWETLHERRATGRDAEMGTARDDASPGPLDADAMLRLIMSGETPKGVASQRLDTAASPTQPVEVSPVGADPFWAAPPAMANDAAPRVETAFSRGVNYETPETTATETKDIASIGEQEIVAAELGRSASGDPRDEGFEAANP